MKRAFGEDAVHSAFGAMHAVGVYVKTQYFKPVLLFGRKKDEGSLAVATGSEHVDIALTRKNVEILLACVCNQHRFRKNRLGFV